MLTLEKIQAALADRNLSEVARRSGVSRSSVLSLASGKGANVTTGIVQKLSNYLEGKQNVKS